MEEPLDFVRNVGMTYVLGFQQRSCPQPCGFVFRQQAEPQAQREHYGLSAILRGSEFHDSLPAASWDRSSKTIGSQALDSSKPRVVGGCLKVTRQLTFAHEGGQRLGEQHIDALVLGCAWAD